MIRRIFLLGILPLLILGNKKTVGFPRNSLHIWCDPYAGIPNTNLAWISRCAEKGGTVSVAVGRPVCGSVKNIALFFAGLTLPWYLISDRKSSTTMRANQPLLYFSCLSYFVMSELRWSGLNRTQFAKARCKTIRLKV